MSQSCYFNIYFITELSVNMPRRNYRSLCCRLCASSKHVHYSCYYIFINVICTYASDCIESSGLNHH